MAEEGAGENGATAAPQDTSKESVYDDDDWIDMTDKEFLQAYPLLSADDKLDEDYIMYVQYATKLAEKEGVSNDFPKFKAWLEKLITYPSNTLLKKRTRNIYLSQLLLQLKDGRLQGILADMPPEGILMPAKNAFPFHGSPQEKTVHDLEMETPLDKVELKFVSRDGRTYLATKSMAEGGSGMCGYLAVSIGEESKGLWLDSCGRPTKVTESSGINVESEGIAGMPPIVDASHSKEENVSLLLKNRLSEEDRLTLKKFYEDILARIDKLIKCYQQTNQIGEINDPVIKQMIERIKCDTPTVGNVRCAPANYHGHTLLLALRKNIACKLETMNDRSKLIDTIKLQVGRDDSGYKMVDLSKKVNDPGAEEVWKNVQFYKPSKAAITNLFTYYGERLVKAVLCLFDRQKQIIYDQEKNAHQETLASYRNDLVEEIRDYVERYLMARNEWYKVHDSLNHLKYVQKEVLKTIKSEIEVEDKSSPIYEESLMISSAIEELQDQINDAKKISAILNKESEELRMRLLKVKSCYRNVYDKLKQTGEQRKKLICGLKVDIKKQERKITELQRYIEESTSCAIYNDEQPC